MEKLLNKKQINNLYNVFDFDENENIEVATFDKNTREMKIIYRNTNDDEHYVYEPDLYKNNAENNAKIKEIFKN